MGAEQDGGTFVTYRALMAFGDGLRKEIKEGFDDIKASTNTGQANHRANAGIAVAATVGVGSLILNAIQLMLLHKR